MDQHSSTPEGLHYPPEGCSVTRPIAGATTGRLVNDPRVPERLLLHDSLKHFLHFCIRFTGTSGQIRVVPDKSPQLATRVAKEANSSARLLIRYGYLGEYLPDNDSQHC